jgi:hypothetical protein
VVLPAVGLHLFGSEEKKTPIISGKKKPKKLKNYFLP